MAWGKNQCDERGREKHLNHGNVPIIAAKDPVEGISMVNSEAFGSTWHEKSVI